MNSTLKAHNRMLSGTYVNQRQVDLIFFLLCFLPLAVSLLLTTDGRYTTFNLPGGFAHTIKTVCLFRLETGFNCPVCGMTRCFAFLSHLNITGAWRMNPAGIPLYALCVYESAFRLTKLINPFMMKIRIFKAFEIALIVIACLAVSLRFVLQFFI